MKTVLEVYLQRILNAYCYTYGITYQPFVLGIYYKNDIMSMYKEGNKES